MMMGSGGLWFSDPTLKINFENGWIDEVKGTAWVPENANVTIGTIRKFGSFAFFANDATTQGAYTAYSANQDVGDKDFTLACWLQFGNTIPTDATAIMGCPNSFAINGYSSNLRMSLWTNASSVLYETPPLAVPTVNNFHYIKGGRKGTKLFLNINGNQVSTTIPANVLATVTDGGFQIGYVLGGIARYIDSVIFVIGVGDDSLDIPTLPF